MTSNIIRGCGRVLAGALCLSTALLIVNDLAAQDSRVKVKASAAVGKIDAAGKQTVTVTLVIDRNWHIYANPVKNDDLKSAATELKFYIGGKLVKADITYPAGQLYKDPSGPKYNCQVYEGKVDIQAVLQRTANDANPIDIDVKFSACDSKNCLTPAEVRLNKENSFSHVPKR